MFKSDSLRTTTATFDDSEREKLNSELQNAIATIKVLDRVIEGLKKDNEALRIELSMSQFPFTYKPVTLEDVKRVWRTQALEKYVLHVDYSQFPPPEEIRDLFTKTKGSYINEWGQKYEGEMVGGKASGFGLLQFVNGDSFEGEFLNGMMHGKGKYTSRVQGFVSQETRVMNVIQGMVSINFKDGRSKFGPWVEGKGVGIHKWLRPNGEIDFTEYKDSQISGLYFNFSPAEGWVNVSEWDRQIKLKQAKKFLFSHDF